MSTGFGKELNNIWFEIKLSAKYWKVRYTVLLAIDMGQIDMGQVTFCYLLMWSAYWVPIPCLALS